MTSERRHLRFAWRRGQINVRVRGDGREHQLRVLIRGCDFFEIEDGSIRRKTIFYDGASFARQIGMLPARDSFADRAMQRRFNAKVRLMPVAPPKVSCADVD